MERYQVYLEAESVRVLDEVAEALQRSRSSIIQEVVGKLARELSRSLAKQRVKRGKKAPIESLCGLFDGPTDLSLREDSRYLRD